MYFRILDSGAPPRGKGDLRLVNVGYSMFQVVAGAAALRNSATALRPKRQYIRRLFRADVEA